jgi:anti-sigma factor RsiW
MNADKTDITLKRLLGPAAEEILCEECFEKLDVYVESELNGQPADERVPGMRAHLEGCPACHEEYESLRALLRAESAGG